jgi:hypothetical protein
MPAAPPLDRDPETGKFLPRSETNLPMEAAMRGIEKERAVKAKPEDDKEKAKLVKEGDRDPQTEPEPEEEHEEVAPEKGAETEPTVEEKAKGFFDEFLEPKAKKEKKEEKAKADTKVTDKAKPAVVAPKKPAPVPPRVAEPLTAADIGKAVAESVAGVLKPKGDAEEKTGADLPPAEQRTYTNLDRMEKLFPENADYKGIADRYKKGLLALERYAADWESKHPGETFDQDAEEHKPFLERNNVDWKDDDYTEAVADIRADAKLEKHNADINKRLSKFERSEKLREEEPKIVEQQNQAAKQIWTEFGDDFAGVITETGQFDGKKIEELAKSDPIGFGHRWAAAGDLNKEAAEVHKLFSGLVDFDPKNQIHVEMDGFISGMEKRLGSKPIEEKTNAEGRVFATQAEWAKLTPSQRENRWTLSSGDVIFHRARFLARESVQKAEQEEKKLRSYAAAKGWQVPEDKANPSGKPKKQAAAEVEEEADPDNDKPQGPGSVPAPKVAALRDRSASDRNEHRNSFLADV